ncbi:MAG: hypothetical protein ACK4QL_07920 [Pseudanabaenaceae cyanobacterium]
MYQVVLELSPHRVHVIAEFPTKEAALDKYMEIVSMNKGSPLTPKGKYTIRKKPAV